MTDLSRLAALARAATQEPIRLVMHRRRLEGAQAQIDLAAEMTPEVVLAMIACIEEAHAMRASWVQDRHAAKFDAALAALAEAAKETT